MPPDVIVLPEQLLNIIHELQLSNGVRGQGQIEDVRDEVRRSSSRRGLVLFRPTVRLIAGSIDARLISQIYARGMRIVMPVDAIEFGVCSIHEWLSELKEDGIEVDHEAVCGNGVGIHL